jgi:hypothetical protein
MSCSSTLRMNPGLPDTSTPCTHMQHKQAAHQPKRAITSMHFRTCTSTVCRAAPASLSTSIRHHIDRRQVWGTCLEDGVVGHDQDAVGQVARVRQEAASGEVGPPLTRPTLQVRPHVHQRLTVPKLLIHTGKERRQEVSQGGDCRGWWGRSEVSPPLCGSRRA